MAVSNVTPSVQYTGNNSSTDFTFTFVVPALQTGNTITDSTASITSGSTTLNVTTADFFYTSALQGKSITINGAGSGGADLVSTINTRNSGTQVDLTDTAGTTVSGATITVTTGLFGTAMKNTGDLEVYVDGVLQTYTTHYTVLLDTGDGSNKGGTVQFVTAPATDAVITIIRDVELSRTVDFQRGGSLTSKDLNAEFDNIVMALQDNIESNESNSLKFPASEVVATADSTLPTRTNRQNKVLTFDGDGDLLVTNTFTASTITSNLVGNVTGDVTGDVTGTVSSLSNLTTTDLAEGTNLYYTDTRFDTRLATKDTDDVSEGATNQYFTNARADARISAASVGDLSDVATTGVSASTGDGNVLAWSQTNQQFEPTPTSIAISAQAPLAYNSGSGQLTLNTDGINDTHIDFGTGANQVNTADIPEQTNLYYTDARARSSISLGTAGTQAYNSTTGVLTIPGTTDHITEGTNLFYTDTRFDTRLATKTTDDLTEGANLYYTDARAQAVSINNVVEDTTPQLGGDLDTNGNALTNATLKFESNEILLGTNHTTTTEFKVHASQQASNKGIKFTAGTSTSGSTGAQLLLQGDNAYLGASTSAPLSVGNFYLQTSNNYLGLASTNQPNNFAGISGGDLNLYQNNTGSTASIKLKANNDIEITPYSTGDLYLDGQKWPQADGSANQYLKTDGAAQLSWDTLTTDDVAEGSNLYYTDARAQAVSINNVVEDTTPQLGGDLDVNGNDIVSTSNGAIDIKPDGTGAFTVDTEGNLEFKAGVSTGPHGWGYWQSDDSIKFLQHTAPDIGGNFDIAQGAYGVGYAPVHIQGGLSIGGGTTPTTDLLFNTGIQIEATHEGFPALVLKAQSDSNKFPNVWFARSGADGSDAYCALNDIVGGFYFSPYNEDNGGYFGTPGKFFARATQNHSNGAMGTKLEWYATPDNVGRDGEIKVLEMQGEQVIVNPSFADVDFVVNSDDNNEIFKVDAGTNKTLVGGVLNVFNRAGNPLSNLANGDIFYDTTANRLKVRENGGFKDITGIGTHDIWVPATAMYPTTTNGCSSIETLEVTAGQPEIRALSFQTSSNTNAQFSIAMPKSWNEGTITFEAYWTPNVSSSGGVTWKVKAVALADDNALGTAFGTAQQSDDTYIAQNDVHISPTSSAITVAGSPSAGDIVYFNLERDTTDANDTMAVDAKLIGIKLHYTTEESTDD